MKSSSPNDLIDLFFEKRLNEEDAQRLLSDLKTSEEYRARFFEQFDVNYLLRYLSLVEGCSLPGSGASSRTKQEDCPSEEELRELLFRYDQSRELQKGTPSEEVALLDESLAWELRQLRFADPFVFQADLTAAASHVDPDPVSSAPRGGKISPKHSSNRQSSVLLKILILLALVLYLPLIYRELNPPPADSARSGAPSPTATIIDMADVRWADETGPSLSLGQPLYSNRLHFTRGTIELLFFNGIQCVVEGPADIVLIDEKQVLCRRGNWSVTVPKQGQGFEIQTPRNVIRDLGTAFHAEIDQEDVRVQVLKGLVELEEPGRETVRLNENQAILARRDGTREPYLIQLDRFISKHEMRRRSDSFLRWDQFFQKSARNPKDPIYRFDLNRPRPPGGIHGGKIVSGRLPDSKAIRFSEAKDRIRLTTSGSAESLSGIVWLRLDKLLFGHNPLLMSKGMERDGLVWQISERGTIILGWRSRKNQGIDDRIESPVVFTEDMLGKWIQLAFAIDGPQRTMTLFMNGQPIMCGVASRSPKLSLANLDLGNWQTAQKGESAFKPIDGAVDEFLLFDTPLNPYDVRAAYGTAPENDP